MDQICDSTEALNGGRLAKASSSDFNRARNAKNSLYSSQQNLSQGGHSGSRPGSTGSNFSRTKFYGSQQNLQTSNKMSLSSVGSASSMDQNRNPVNGYESANASVDPWLNAWDSPAAQPPPSAQPQPRQNHNNNFSSASSGQFRMPGPPASSNGNGGGLGFRNGLSNNIINNNNNNSSVHSNGNRYGSSSGNGIGRQLGNNLSSSTAQQQLHTRNLNTLNNNNNYSDPWSGDSPFYFLPQFFMFCIYSRAQGLLL